MKRRPGNGWGRHGGFRFFQSALVRGCGASTVGGGGGGRCDGDGSSCGDNGTGGGSRGPDGGVGGSMWRLSV